MRVRGARRRGAMGRRSDSVDVSVDMVGKDLEVAHVVGRNGMFKARAVSIWKGPGPAHIEAIGARGLAIRGSVVLPAERMDELAMKWLQARGVVMPAR